MKKLLVIALFAAACGGNKKPETMSTTTSEPSTPVSNTDPDQPPAAPTGEGTPCAQEIAMVCPDGQIDACLKTPPEGDVHACVAK